MFKQILMTSVIGSSVLFTACTNMPDQGNTTVDVVQAQLLDRNWTVTYIGNTEIVKTSQAVQTLPSLMLESATQRFSGTDGCNRIMGSYQLTNKGLVFGQMASTRMACLNPSNQQVAAAYNEALAKVSAYQVYHKTLKLLDRHGNVVMQLSSPAPLR